MGKLKRALKRAAAYSAGGSVGPAPKSHKLVGEFRDPGERAGGIPFLIPYGKNPRNVDRELGARRTRDPNEDMPGNWYGPVTAGRADGGSVIDALRESFEMRGAHTPDGEDRARTGLDTIHEVAGMLPVSGNLMAAGEAYGSGRDALAAARKGRYKDAAVDAGLAAVSAAGALSPLPWSRSAGRAARHGRDSVNALVPATEGPASALAREMRETGVGNEGVFRNTGRFFSPDGTLRQEVSDRGMRVKRIFEPGDSATMGDLVDHPELFARYPDMAGRPVRFVDERVVHENAPGKVFGNAFLDADGTGYGMSGGMPEEFYKEQAAKLMNYRIGEMEGFSPAMRHKAALNLGEFDRAIASLPPGPTLDRIQAQRDLLARAMETGDNRILRRVGGKLNDTALGNVDARIVRQRAIMPDEDMRAWGPYPYAKGARDTGRGWKNSVILPGARVDPAEFIDRFTRFGAGRPEGFANGGRAAARGLKKAGVTVGAVRGKTGGRADALPVDVPAGSYVIPADVVAALGEGNTEAGMHRLEQKFGRARKANGGSVPILISDGEFVVPPDAVEQFGGHDRMDTFVLTMRKAFAQHLNNIPPPNQ